MPVNVCMRRGPICERTVVHKHEHTEPHTKANETMCVGVVLKTHAVKGLGTQGKCVRLVLKACADKQKCVYLGV